MKELTPHSYFKFGQAFGYLQKCRDGSDRAEVLTCLIFIRDFLKENNLKTSYRVLGTLFDETFKSLDACSGKIINNHQASSIKEKIEIFFLTISAEALDQKIYITNEKRYEASKLLTGVDKLFAPNVFNALPDIAKFDFKEACNCILFERPTAAAFHLMRGTEDIIKGLYKILSGSSEKPGNGTWGDYENALRHQFQDRVSLTLLDQMKNLRGNFRNPTQHPVKIYDLDEAQDLLNISIDIANRISKVS